MSNFKTIALILLLIVIGQSTVDIYLPSLPGMVHEFGTTATYVQLTLTAFLIGFSISQLFYGPLADHFGRKPILLIGMFIYLIGSALCVTAPSVEVFFIARLLQGLGIGAASTISKAITRDVYSGKALAKVSSYVSMSWALVPILAPVVGSYIQTYLGWRQNFSLLTIGAILLIVFIIMSYKETNPKQVQRTRPIKNYKKLLKSKVFVKYILCVMLIYGVFVYFNIAGPFLLQDNFHLSVIAYGWWLVFVSSGFIIGAYLSGKLINKLRSEKIVAIGIFFLMVASLIMTLLALFRMEYVLCITIPMFFVSLGTGLMYPQCIAQSLSPFPKIAGSASALFGFMVFLGGTISSLIIAHLPEKNAVPFSSMIFIYSILIFLVYFVLDKLFQDSKEDGQA